MRTLEKLKTIMLISIIIFYGFLFKGIGQILASNGSVDNNLTERPLTSGDRRLSLDGDTEIEDTIREINRFTLSDSLWKIWRAIEDSQFVVAKVDSINSLKSFLQGVKLTKQGFNLINDLKNQNLDSLAIRKTKYNAILLFEKARKYFEQTFKLNPFDIRTQNYLIWIFQNLAELHDHCNNTLRAINMLECLTYILNDDSELYFTLGEKYFNIGRWDRALTCVRTSIDLILDDDWNKIDTKKLFWHYYLRANVEIQLNMTQQALLSLSYAKLIAPTEVEAREIQKRIEWINWDDGNLYTSRKSDTLDYKLHQGQEDYFTIKKEYLDLLNQVRTIQAKQDINWRIAQLEFRFLNEQEQAVERMLKIIKEVELDSTKENNNTRIQKYFDDFGSMCYILGMEHLRLGRNKEAFIYFFQSIEFWWSQIGKSYLQLAKLSCLDNNSVLKFANQAVKYQKHLTEDERNSLYYLIFLAYKKMGMFEDAAEWFQKAANYTMGR